MRRPSARNTGHPVCGRSLRIFVGPGCNRCRVDNVRDPALPVVGGDFGSKRAGDNLVIKAKFLLDNAPVPNGMETGPALSVDGDQVAAAVVVEGDVQGLMDISNPVAKAFEKAKLVADVEAEGKVAGVIQNGGDHATIRDLAGSWGSMPFAERGIST